jgi:hypothetical protein
MGCKQCLYPRGHHPHCPDAGDVPEVFVCYECKESILEGDTYYRIGDKKYCKSCVDAGRDVAEVEDYWDDRF